MMVRKRCFCFVFHDHHQCVLHLCSGIFLGGNGCLVSCINPAFLLSHFRAGSFSWKIQFKSTQKFITLHISSMVISVAFWYLYKTQWAVTLNLYRNFLLNYIKMPLKQSGRYLEFQLSFREVTEKKIRSDLCLCTLCKLFLFKTPKIPGKIVRRSFFSFKKTKQ